MSLAPSGQLATPLKLFRDTLAASSTWQTLAGATSAAAALPYIHYFGLDRPLAWAAAKAYALKQFIRVEAGTDFIYECTVAGTSDASEPTWPEVADETVEDNDVTWTARAVTQGRAHYSAMIVNSRPFAIIDLAVSESHLGAIIGVGTANDFTNRGSIDVLIEADIPAAYANSIESAGLWFANQIGAIVDELAALSGTAGYLNITGYDVKAFHHSREAEEKVEGEFCRALLTFTWE